MAIHVNEVILARGAEVYSMGGIKSCEHADTDTLTAAPPLL